MAKTLLHALVLLGLLLTAAVAFSQEALPLPPSEDGGALQAQTGIPSIAVRGFSVAPNIARPGDNLTIRLELVNQGTAAAQGIIVSLGQSDSFVPAGASSITVGDLFPGAAVQVVLNANVTNSASNGANVIPIAITFRSPEGETVNTSGSASVTIQKTPSTSLLTLMNYTITPSVVMPGELAKISIDVLNAGTSTALNVLIRFTGDGNVLQPGSKGDTFLVGNVFPSGRITVETEMLISQQAKSGSQIQPIEIVYTDDSGEKQTFSTNITVIIDRSTRPEPLILLKDYTIDKEELAPGDSFVLKATVENIGQGDAINTLASFGSNITQSSNDRNSDNDDGTNTDAGTTSGTTTGATFAPIGTGETTFIGTLTAAGSVTLEQAFLVSGMAKSGIYNLPITLRYTLPNGESAKTILQVNLLVVSQPRIQVTLQNPLPSEIEQFSTLVLSWQVQNLEAVDVRLGSARVTAQGGEIINGAETFLGRLTADRRSTFEATINAVEEGTLTVKLEIDYTDDMNRPKVFTYEYVTTVTAPMQPPEMTEEPPMIDIPTETPSTNANNVNILIELLFGLLGLGQ